jgi:hypothetical protein
VNQYLEHLRRRFEKDDDHALLRAVDAIVIWFGPKWVQDNWMDRFDDFNFYRVPTLDAAFKVQRRKPKLDRRRREEWRVKLVHDITLMEKGMPRARVFKWFAEANDVDISLVEDAFHGKASLPWRERLVSGVALMEKGMPRTRAFELYAKENNVSRQWVENVFYEPASRPWHKLFNVRRQLRRRR